VLSIQYPVYSDFWLLDTDSYFIFSKPANQLTNPKRDTIHEIRDTYLVVCEKKVQLFSKKEGFFK